MTEKYKFLSQSCVCQFLNLSYKFNIIIFKKNYGTYIIRQNKKIGGIFSHLISEPRPKIKDELEQRGI